MFGVYGLKPSRQTVSLFKSTQATGVLCSRATSRRPRRPRPMRSSSSSALAGPCSSRSTTRAAGFSALKAASPVSGNAALGRARDPKLAYAVYRQMARELAPLGIRMNLAPVLDVATKNYNPGIGIRSFGSNPLWRDASAPPLFAGCRTTACPRAQSTSRKGRGDRGRAHRSADDQAASRRVLAYAPGPFRAACAAGVDAVMTSHVRYPSLDAEPGTFSKKIVRDILRGELAYDGLVVSDDLCMGAITKRWQVAEAALKCLDAGHDVLMIAHDLQGMADSVDLLREAGAPEENLAAADARITRLLHRRKAPAAELAEGAKLSSLIANRAVVVARQGETLLPIPLSPKTLMVIPDFKEVREALHLRGRPRQPRGPRAPPGARLLICARADLNYEPLPSARTRETGWTRGFHFFRGPALPRPGRRFAAARQDSRRQNRRRLGSIVLGPRPMPLG